MLLLQMRQHHTADVAQAKISVNSSVCVDLKGKAHQPLSLTYFLHLCASKQQQQIILCVAVISSRLQRGSRSELVLMEYSRSKCCFISLLTSLNPTHLITQRQRHPRSTTVPLITVICLRMKNPDCCFLTGTLVTIHQRTIKGILILVYVLQI